MQKLIGCILILLSTTAGGFLYGVEQQQYLEKLKSMRHNIYLDGECIGRDDPRIVKASSAIRMTFSLVDNPEMHDLMTATSHITGKTINRFTHIHCPSNMIAEQSSAAWASI